MSMSLFLSGSIVVEAVEDVLGGMYLDILVMLCFAVSAVVCRPMFMRKGKQMGKTMKVCKAKEDSAILEEWQSCREHIPLDAGSIRPVVQALLNEAPGDLISQLVGHIDKHRNQLCNPTTAAAVLGVVARSGKVELMEGIAKEFQDKFAIESGLLTEMLMAGYAFAGEEGKIAEIVARGCEPCEKAFSLAIEGFLTKGMLGSAIKHCREMHQRKMLVPTYLVTEIFRLASENGKCREVFFVMDGMVDIDTQAFAWIVESLKPHDLEFAKSLEKSARYRFETLPACMFDPLLKVYAFSADSAAIELWRELQQADRQVSDGFGIALISRCAESKFPRFAEEIFRTLRARGSASVPLYGALMKVYSNTSDFSKACDLFSDMRADRLKPDSSTFANLLRFATECGRTDIIKDLSAPELELDANAYLALIRFAGRNKDVVGAFDILQRMIDSGKVTDAVPYNFVLDACVSTGEMARAREVFNLLRETGLANAATVGIFLKGVSQACDLFAAKELCEELAKQGAHVDDVTYNNLLRAAVRFNGHDLEDAWSVIDLMEKRGGVAVDCYALSIMMKAVRKLPKSAKDVNRILSLLDASGVDILSDIVLLSGALELCTRHHKQARLQGLVEDFFKSELVPNTQLCGSLIRACSNLNRFPDCWVLWNGMINRGVEPTEWMLGCMLEALVAGREVDEAVKLVAQYKDRVPANTALYLSLMKGYATTNQRNRALATWHDLRKTGIKLRGADFAIIIEVFGKLGLMGFVGELMKAMDLDGVVPDSNMFGNILGGYCSEGDLGKALEVLELMHERGLVKDGFVYGTLIEACNKMEDLEKAEALMKDMLAHNVSPTPFAVVSLIKLYGKGRRVDKAFEMVAESGVGANSQVQTALVVACVSGNSLTRALQLLEVMKQSPQGVTGKAYSVLIHAFSRNGWLDKAVGLLEEAIGLNGKQRTLPAGGFVDDNAFENLFQALGKSSQGRQLAKPLVEQLKAKGERKACERLQALLSRSDAEGGSVRQWRH